MRICFGLHRDESIKKGQIAHLDGNPSNYRVDNLAFLCLEHHDLFDSTTSQSKNLTIPEVKVFRKELESRFYTWTSETDLNQFLSFLADQTDLKTMADAAERAAGRYVWYARDLALEALTCNTVEYCDMDLWGPLVATLGHFQSWGWLTYTVKERKDRGGAVHVRIKVDREPICDEVAKAISERKPSNENGLGVAS